MKNYLKYYWEVFKLCFIEMPRMVVEIIKKEIAFKKLKKNYERR